MASMQTMKPASMTSTSRRAQAARPVFSSAVKTSRVCSRAVSTSQLCGRRVAASAQARNVAVRATAAAAPTPALPKPTTETKQWYALVASADFYFNDPQNESMAEQLRERVRFMTEQKKDLDFAIIPEPKWLANYPEQAQKVKKPAVALVTTDKQWAIFMKLRLDRVLRIDLPATMTDAEVLAVGGEIPNFGKPAKWTAPYAPYTPGWWNVFVPGKQ